MAEGVGETLRDQMVYMNLSLDGARGAVALVRQVACNLVLLHVDIFEFRVRKFLDAVSRNELSTDIISRAEVLATVTHMNRGGRGCRQLGRCSGGGHVSGVARRLDSRLLGRLSSGGACRFVRGGLCDRSTLVTQCSSLVRNVVAKMGVGAMIPNRTLARVVELLEALDAVPVVGEALPAEVGSTIARMGSRRRSGVCGGIHGRRRSGSGSGNMAFVGVFSEEESLHVPFELGVMGDVHPQSSGAFGALALVLIRSTGAGHAASILHRQVSFRRQ